MVYLYSKAFSPSYEMAAAKFNFINQRNEPHHEKEHNKISNTASNTYFQDKTPKISV